MGNQVWKFVIFLYVYIPVIYACFCEHVCRAPWVKNKNPGDATACHSEPLSLAVAMSTRERFRHRWGKTSSSAYQLA